MNLSDITIIILSRGREEILKQSLTYWGYHSIKVLVLHNTKNPLEYKDLGINIEYKIINGSYGVRCGEVSKLITTQYAILCSDDEVYIPSALLAMKEKLDDRPDLSSVGGMTLAVDKYGPLVTGIHSYSAMKNYVNNGPDKYSRLRTHFKTNEIYKSGGIYRMLKADLMKIVMTTFAEIPHISTPYIFEVTGEIIINAYGKSEYIDNIYWMRNWINEPVAHKDWNRRLYFHKWIESQNYEEEVTEWKRLICRNIDLDAESFNNILQDIIIVRKKSETNEIERLKKTRMPVPKYSKWLIRRIIKKKSLPKSITETLESMKANGAIYSQEEIIRALNALL